MAARFAADAEKSDLERARSVLERKYRVPATGPKEYARRARFLQSRGFSMDVIRRALASLRNGATEESP